MISATNGNHKAYYENMLLLRLANDDRIAGMAQLGSMDGPIPTGEEVLIAFKKTLRWYLPNPFPTIPFFGSLKNGESTLSTWIRSFLNRTGKLIENGFIHTIDKGMEFTGKITPHESLRRKAKALTDRAIIESFYPVIQELLDRASRDHNVTIEFAALSLPEYFPSELEYAPMQACISLGINTPPISLPKPLAALASVSTKPDARILLLDHGRYHMSVRVMKRDGAGGRNPIKEFFVPNDSFGGGALEMDLFSRVTQKGVIKDQLLLKEKLNLDQEKGILKHKIKQARILIKNNLFDFIGKNENDNDDSEGDTEVDHHHDEWPLNLDNWWTIIDDLGPSSVPSVVLEWEDVRAAEDHYVERLSSTLDIILRVARSQPHCPFLFIPRLRY
jgi:hypothetical protein